MAHAAIAFAKASFRRRFMAATSSIGPGATNMVTAAALAHVNRLPVLLLPGDVFANRAPDPVLQQVERFRRRHGHGQRRASARCRAISTASPGPSRSSRRCSRAMQVLTDPAECGPVTLSLCQDVQAEAYDYPESFFAERVWTPRRPQPDARRTRRGGRRRCKAAKKPVIIAGGGVLYSEAAETLRGLRREARHSGLETQAGKSSPAARPSAQHGLGRRHRHVGRQPAGRAGRRGARGRHAPAGFHHRLLGAVQGRRRQDRRAQRAAVRCRQAPRAAAGRRRQGRARRARRSARRLASAPTPGPATAKAGKDRLAGGRRRRDRPDQCRCPPTRR